MISKTNFAFAVFVIALGSSCSFRPQAQKVIQPAAVHFVTVEKDVQLEVIDWGGTGKSIVLLAGGGNTAHVFDDFAPKLARYFHVYGITRRGFGRSQFSNIENKARLAADILAVLDWMKIQAPVLAGHSIAGVELSEIARTSPKRIAGVVYLEAAYPYAFNNNESPSMNEFFDVKGPPQPSPGEKDLTSFSALQDWNTKTYGFKLPESEYRQMWDSLSADKPLRRRDAPGFALFQMMLNSSGNNDNIPVASLVIYALPHKLEAWAINAKDDTVRQAAADYFLKIDSLTVKQANALEKKISSARVVKLTGMHYIFISNETEVVEAITEFVESRK